VKIAILALLLAFLASTPFLTGCAVAETSAEEVGQQFTEGLQGRGRIVPNDPTSDEFGPLYQ
jgi:hypothetical protein